MKKRFLILALLSLMAQSVWGTKSTFYGYIYKYPITMEINFDDGGAITGHYYYDKQKKNITLTGDLETEKNKIQLQTTNGTETFAGYLLDYQEQKKNRIIGRWKYKNKDLPFELQKKKFTTKNRYFYEKTGLNIDPTADKYFQIEEMEIFTDAEFKYSYYKLFGSDHIRFNTNPNILDKTNIQEMLRLTEKVRSEDNYGHSYSGIVCRNTLVTFLRLYYTPHFFVEDSQESVYSEDEDWSIGESKNSHFTFWAFSSVYNFNLHKEFCQEEAKSKKKIIAYYMNEGFNKSEANFLALKIIFSLRDRAYGSSPSAEYREVPLLLQKIIAGKETATILEEIATEKYDDHDLGLCLNAAISLKRDKQIMEKLLEKIEDCNSFEESPLSCAVQDLQTMKFLLNQRKCYLNVNHQNWFRKTPLFYAIQYSNHEVVDYLLQKGADINQKYSSKAEIDKKTDNCEIFRTQRTPLMHAAQNSDVKMLKLLLKNGAKIRELDEIGNNAADYALAEKNEENLQFLQKYKLSPTGNWKNFSRSYW